MRYIRTQTHTTARTLCFLFWLLRDNIVPSFLVDGSTPYMHFAFRHEHEQYDNKRRMIVTR